MRGSLIASAHRIGLWCLAATALNWIAVQAPTAAVEGRITLETLAGKLETREAAEPGEIRFGADGLAFLRYEGPRPERSVPLARVDLSDGQRWCGNVAGGSGDRLRWRTALGPELELSVDHVARLEFRGRLAELDRAALEPAREGDRLYWAHADSLERVDGTFESFSDEGVVLASVLGKRVFPWSEVGALFIAPLDDAPAPAPVSGVPLSVDLADGSRIRAGFAGAGPGGLSLSLPGHGALEVAYNQLIEATLDDGSVSFLSSMPPARAQEGSLFGDDLGLRWPHRVDLSVVGSGLAVGGQSFSRGLGVHAPSRLEWILAPAGPNPARPARELTGSVGVDDSVRALSAHGSVRFQVFVDGVARWDSGVVRGGEPARAMPRIDLRGAKELALVVDPSEDSFVADRADWLRLILVRGP